MIDAPLTQLPPIVAGDDWYMVWYPDDDTEAGSSDDAATWSDLLVVVRKGRTRNSRLLATSAGEPPDGVASIITTGHTFTGTGGDYDLPLQLITRREHQDVLLGCFEAAGGVPDELDSFLADDDDDAEQDV